MDIVCYRTVRRRCPAECLHEMPLLWGIAKYGKLFVESWRRQAETKSLPGTRHTNYRLLWQTIFRTAHKHSGALSGVFHGYIMGVSYGTFGGILWHFGGYPMGILGYPGVSYAI